MWILRESDGKKGLGRNVIGILSSICVKNPAMQIKQLHASIDDKLFNYNLFIHTLRIYIHETYTIVSYS